MREEANLRSNSVSVEYWIITLVAIAKVLIQLLALSHSGYLGDEFLHIEAGKHLALGYQDFPPVIAILAWVQNGFQSDSIYIHHLFNIVSSVLIIVFSGLITLELGGKRIALLISLLCIFFAPGLAGAQFLFLPTAFEQLFWVICIYFLAKYGNTSLGKYVLLFGVFAGLGFLTKYSIAFLLGGVVVSIMLLKRKLFSDKVFWYSVAVFLIIISLNIYWQVLHHFPVFQHFSQLYDRQLNQLSKIGQMSQLVLFLNPATFPLWLAGLLVLPFHVRFKKYRLLTFTLLFSFAMLFAAKGKWYYYFPIILGLIPLGAVYFEQLFSKNKWIAYLYMAFISVVGVYLLPNGIPVLKLSSYIRFYNLTHNQEGKMPLPFDNYYSAEIWDKTLTMLKDTYNKMDQSEQEKCLICGRHYAMAGAVNLLGTQYNLPQAFSLHTSFEWMPEFGKDAIVMAVGEANWLKQHWEDYFYEVEEIGVVNNAYAQKETDYCYRLYLCRKPKYDSKQLSKLLTKGKS